jgi:RimJ/RimL family protein N-acetyltransferase
MADVVLERPARDRLLELAHVVSAHPVDPPGVSDHSWLHGDAHQVEQRLQRSLDHCVRHGGAGWILLADRHPVGLITVKVVDGDAETFSFVATTFQNGGLATAARAAVIALLQGDARVRRVISTSRPGSASARVSQRLGYTYVGRETRTHPLDGSDVDLDRYELDPARWSRPPGVEHAVFAG